MMKPIIYLIKRCCFWWLVLSFSVVQAAGVEESAYTLKAITSDVMQQAPGKSGMYVLETGQTALFARAWLAEHAVQSIDVQYFIWSTDNVGILAAEALLSAAQRGVQVRVIVDDFLIDAEDETIAALALHPNIHIRIYNPNMSVGTSTIKKMRNVLTDFRGVNQRMHDKTFVVDGEVVITGGRNMADEYYDFNQEYNFRDRDALLIGPVVRDVQKNFEAFWHSPLTVPVEKLLEDNVKQLTPAAIAQHYQQLHDYAADPDNFAQEVRAALNNLPSSFAELANELVWDDIVFLSDTPGKNRGDQGLAGGGEITKRLTDLVSSAKQSITIQSPYLIVPDGGIELFARLSRQGVKIKISTNSLASTDNLLAFSGYAKQRKKLLNAGVEVFEYRPAPDIFKTLFERQRSTDQSPPVFALHAKTMVIDEEILYIGTFNLDPRSANLNTEVGVLVSNRALAKQVENAIHQDIRPENSWNARTDDPDQYAPLKKRVKVRSLKLLPLDPVL